MKESETNHQGLNFLAFRKKSVSHNDRFLWPHKTNFFKDCQDGGKSGIFLKIVQAPAKQTKFMLFIHSILSLHLKMPHNQQELNP